MNMLGSSLAATGHFKDAVIVQEAQLSMWRRLGAEGGILLPIQNNLANTYAHLGRHEDALQMQRDVYSGRSTLLGEGDDLTLSVANNYANSLMNFKRYGEAKSLLHKTVPVARRVLGDSNDLTLRMRCLYARTLCLADGATPDDLREAVNALEDVERIERRALGGAHPIVVDIERRLRNARAKLRAHEDSVA